LLFAVLAGCATDDPVGPPSGDPYPSVNFDLPESTLATLERSVEHRRVSDYALCLTDSVGRGEPGFYASFDPADLIEWLQAGNPPPPTWTFQREVTFFPSFLAYVPGAFYAMTLVPTRADELPDADTRILHRSYRVFAGSAPVAAGEAVLTFRRVGLAGEWKIRFWEDRRDTSGVRTWGTARLEGR
jgi:hypothetical protein